MPIVTFSPSGKTVEVASGTSLFDAANQAGLPVASSCSAELVCGRCNMKVLHGSDQISPQSEIEKKLLKKEKKPESDRISCGAWVHGDCTVTTSYW
jgi:ferredoxin